MNFPHHYRHSLPQGSIPRVSVRLKARIMMWCQRITPLCSTNSLSGGYTTSQHAILTPLTPLRKLQQVSPSFQASNEAVESQQCVWNPVINPQLRKRGEVTRLSMLFLTTTALTIGLPRFSLHGEGSPAHPHAGKQSSCTLSVQSHTTSFRHSKPLQHVREKNDLCACMYARKTVTVLKSVNSECMSRSFS